LLSQNAEVIGALEEHFHQIGPGGTAAGQQIFQGWAPVAIEDASGWRCCSDHAVAGGEGGALPGLKLLIS
jgi:hypothetical protein